MSAVVFVSAVRDFAMHSKCVAANPACAGCEIAAIDNRTANDGIGKLYNRFLDSRSAGEDAWYVFCHEDWMCAEPPGPLLAKADPGAIYGPIGARTRLGAFGWPHWELVGAISECEKDGSGMRRIGREVPPGTPLDTFDCQCIAVHSSLVRRYRLRFDENLLFDLYAEDFSIAALENHGVRSLVLPVKCVHFSRGSVGRRYREQEAYLKRKYPRSAHTGTSSWLIGGGGPLLWRLVAGLKRRLRDCRCRNFP